MSEVEELKPWLRQLLCRGGRCAEKHTWRPSLHYSWLLRLCLAYRLSCELSAPVRRALDTSPEEPQYQRCHNHTRHSTISTSVSKVVQKQKDRKWIANKLRHTVLKPTNGEFFRKITTYLTVKFDKKITILAGFNTTYWKFSGVFLHVLKNCKIV